MLIYAIKSKNNNNDVLILHALPNEITKFQWYIAENIHEKGIPIDGQIYESYTLSTEMIKENSYDGKYLYCVYLDKETGDYQYTKYIRLGLSIDNMTKDGIVFDNISEFNEQGNIISK